jgi:3-hydroxyisobutyrate dehydrogenase-like beta-hydroxyacid dehydrogenase
MAMKVAVLGLGEAGSVLAADLAHSGDEVHGYDPRPIPAPPGVNRLDTPDAAVAGCALVLAVVAASQADDALTQVLESLENGAIYADLSTASPGLKEALADRVAGRTALFVDVALMAPVPGRGLAAPALASGSGAAQYAKLINARGGQVEVVGERAGQAAARKLLRSVVMKGLAALLIESTEAATHYGQGEWFWNHLVDQLGSIDEALMERLLSATAIHAPRRLEEMEAARDLLTELGVPPFMTNATITHLRRLLEEGMPEVYRQSSINPTED